MMTSDFATRVSEKIHRRLEFREDYIQLVRSELGEQKVPLSNNQIKRLLETSAIFALSQNELHQKLASKIGIFLLSQYANQFASLPYVVELIITRLGDLPTVAHIVNNYDGEDYFWYFKDSVLFKDIRRTDYESIPFDRSMLLRYPEILLRKMNNQISFAQKKGIVLTDFQSKIYNLLIHKESIAFSAPTSTGKSYLLHHYIAHRISESTSFCAIYIVPTKALIAEVQADILTKINELQGEFGEFTIFSSINYLNVSELIQYQKKVFVLTQERLQEVLASNIDLGVDLLVVDEAQKISDETRGIVIEDSVQELVSRNPKMQIVLISPYIKDPERFKDIFNIEKDVHPEKTSKSPVNQNHIFVDFRGKRSQKEVVVSLLSQELGDNNHKEIIELQRIRNVKGLPSTLTERKAWVAKNLVKEDEPTLVYCNIPYDCRLVGKKLITSKELHEAPKELQDATTFMRQHVHDKFYLADFLKDGIGYHYGRMPQFVRFYVKDLFERKQLKILCCTSTLLEGVNLPAKNVILYKPRAGKVMDKLSVLNLAGRAGRLLKDYYGKIFVLNYEEWDQEGDLFDNKLEPIESSAEETLISDIDILIQYLKDPEFRPKENVQVLATSLIVRQILDPESNFLLRYHKRRREHISQIQLDQIKEQLVRIVSEFPAGLMKTFLENRSIDPRFQLNLYNEMKDNPFLIPVPFPTDEGFYGRLKCILRIISRVLLKQEHNRYLYLTKIANDWISQKSYKAILDAKILFEVTIRGKSASKTFINKMIDNLDDDLENVIKYDYTRSLKCYTDIMEYIMRERNDARTQCKLLSVYLEAGAYDEKVLIMLGLGLSRNTCIMIHNSFPDLPNWGTIVKCKHWFKGNRERFNVLDVIMQKEIDRALTGN